MFLAQELSSIFEEIDEVDRCAHEVCVCLSVRGSNIPETFYRMYTDHMFVDKDERRLLTNAVAYFSGAGFMNVVCDCESYYQISCELHNIATVPFFHAGMSDLDSKSEVYIATLDEIASLRLSVFN